MTVLARRAEENRRRRYPDEMTLLDALKEAGEIVQHHAVLGSDVVDLWMPLRGLAIEIGRDPGTYRESRRKGRLMAIKRVRAVRYVSRHHAQFRSLDVVSLAQKHRIRRPKKSPNVLAKQALREMKEKDHRAKMDRIESESKFDISDRSLRKHLPEFDSHGLGERRTRGARG